MTDVTDISELEDDAVPENQSLVDKIKTKFLNKKSTGSDETDEAAAARKKRSKIIQITIGAALILFIFSDEFLPKEDAPSESGEVKLKPRPKPNRQQTPAQATNTEGTDASGTETPGAETAVAETPATEAPVTETPSTETTVSETPAIETPQDTAVSPAEDTSIVETAPDSPVDVTSTEAPVETIEASPVDTTSDVAEPTVTSPAPDSFDSIDGDQSVTTSDENLTDQILQDLEKQAKTNKPAQQKTQYVAPPDYEYRGRALVYNCVGKHWACVDGPSYKTCEDNSSSVQYLKKRTECHPFNIYETVRGCEIMQNRMVSSTAKTTFCN